MRRREKDEEGGAMRSTLRRVAGRRWSDWKRAELVLRCTSVWSRRGSEFEDEKREATLDRSFSSSTQRKESRHSQTSQAQPQQHPQRNSYPPHSLTSSLRFSSPRPPSAASPSPRTPSRARTALTALPEALPPSPLPLPPPSPHLSHFFPFRSSFSRAFLPPLTLHHVVHFQLDPRTNFSHYQRPPDRDQEVHRRTCGGAGRGLRGVDDGASPEGELVHGARSRHAGPPSREEPERAVSNEQGLERFGGALAVQGAFGLLSP
jgi:hypothetical protein